MTVMLLYTLLWHLGNSFIDCMCRCYILLVITERFSGRVERSVRCVCLFGR